VNPVRNTPQHNNSNQKQINPNTPSRETPRKYPQHSTLLIAAGGGIGASLRWGILQALNYPGPGLNQPSLVWPVILVNLIGCVLLGTILVKDADKRTHLLIGAGFCGGLTTFSTFAVDAAEMLRDSHLTSAAIYTGISVCSGLGGFILGRHMGHLLAGIKIT